MQRRTTFGGGVSPRGTLLRGQSIIEYVLIIAIIGLVIVFAGPGVAGAIRNQFNQVTNTVDSGTGGDSFMSAEEKAEQEAAKNVQAAVAKDAKDWTLVEQEAVAKDIAKNGTSSIACAKAKAAMDAGTNFSMKLSNGKTLEYRIIGINHDDLADGSGKAGLTFLTTSMSIKSRMNATASNVGGWEKSELRQKMNSGEIWNLMPSDFQSKVKSVRKLTNNVSGRNNSAAVTSTFDKLFLLSYSELAGMSSNRWPAGSWIYNEGARYEAFRDKVMNNSWLNGDNIPANDVWWERTAEPDDYDSTEFFAIDSDADSSGRQLYNNREYPTNTNCVCPAFCF